ncbi:MAG: hydrogenase maturation protease [Streptosporangiales bacterium]|nr:hydrogenase maturation protease [Streptosporangiales bacterium]
MADGRVLVAGVGNVFLGDDGFGVEVARRLAAEPLPDGVEVADFGIRGVHLAYQLLDGYDALILVDSVSRGGEPGTVYVLEPDLDAVEPAGSNAETPLMDAHGMTPDAVFSLLKALGGSVDRALIVGCEPAEITERMGLSETVGAAVEPAVHAVRDLLTGPPPATDQPSRGQGVNR